MQALPVRPNPGFKPGGNRSGRVGIAKTTGIENELGKKAEPISGKAFVAFLGLLVVLAALPFFLNHLAWAKFQKSFPFEYEGSPNLYFPGRISASSMLLKRSGFEIQTGEIEVKYAPVTFLFRRELSMQVKSETLVLRISDPALKKAEAFSSLSFDSLAASLVTDVKGGTEIRSLRLDGPSILAYAKGRVKKRDLALKVRCFLKPGFVLALPKFLSEHLFSARDSALKEIQFELSGEWNAPSFSIASDLVRFEVNAQDLRED